MKLIAVSRVKNEIDIIEPFVRHHARHFDKLIVLDDGSTDGTYEALRSLQNAGLPVVLLREPSIGYEQNLYMSRLLHMAFDQFGADWVAPLDADEFIEPPPGAALAQVLPPDLPELFMIGWNNFVWRPEDEENPEPNPVRRLRLRLPSQHRLKKVLVSAKLAAKGGFELLQGNHGIRTDGLDPPLGTLDGVNLCHYPIRGVAQYASKIAMGYLQYSATPHWNPGLGFHYIEAFRQLKGGLDQLARTMEAASRHYSLDDDTAPGPEPVEAPLRYDGGPLTLAASREDPLASVLHYAETLARQRAALVEREDALHAALNAAAAPTSDWLAERIVARRLGIHQAENGSREGQLALQPPRPDCTAAAGHRGNARLPAGLARIARRLCRALEQAGLPAFAIAERILRGR